MSTAPAIRLHRTHKTGVLTHVFRESEPEEEYLGYVKRVYVSNPTPRGGAYRWEHQAKTPRGLYLGQYTTRKEAIEQIIRQSPKKDKTA